MSIFSLFYHLPKYNLWTLLQPEGKTTVLTLYACMCDMIYLIKYWGTVYKKPKEV